MPKPRDSIKHAAQSREHYHRKKLDPEWMEKRRAVQRERARKYRAEKPEKSREAVRRYEDKNREMLRRKWREWAKAHPDKARSERRRAQSLAWSKARPGIHRKYKLGVTLEQFAALLESQHGKCLACQIDLRTLPRKQIHLDHCHSTKRIRGILCHACNTTLGLMKENAARLRALADYIDGGLPCNVLP